MQENSFHSFTQKEFEADVSFLDDVFTPRCNPIVKKFQNINFLEFWQVQICFFSHIFIFFACKTSQNSVEVRKSLGDTKKKLQNLIFAPETHENTKEIFKLISQNLQQHAASANPMESKEKNAGRPSFWKKKKKLQPKMKNCS